MMNSSRPFERQPRLSCRKDLISRHRQLTHPHLFPLIVLLLTHLFILLLSRSMASGDLFIHRVLATKLYKSMDPDIKTFGPRWVMLFRRNTGTMGRLCGSYCSTILLQQSSFPTSLLFGTSVWFLQECNATSAIAHYSDRTAFSLCLTIFIMPLSWNSRSRTPTFPCGSPFTAAAVTHPSASESKKSRQVFLHFILWHSLLFPIMINSTPSFIFLISILRSRIPPIFSYEGVYWTIILDSKLNSQTQALICDSQTQALNLR